MIGHEDRVLRKETPVQASLADVWDAWTTAEGVTTFLAPKAKVELRIGGPYEPYFDVDAPEGSRGGEGLVVLSYLPMEMFSFTWAAPPQFPNVRKEKCSWVVVQMNDLASNLVQVRLTQLGWKSGEEWEQVYDYFDRAWSLVLARLAYRFSVAPIDWAHPFRPAVK